VSAPWTVDLGFDKDVTVTRLVNMAGDDCYGGAIGSKNLRWHLIFLPETLKNSPSSWLKALGTSAWCEGALIW